MWPTPLPLTHNAIHLPIHPSIHLLRISTPRIWILWRPLQEPQGKLVSIFNLLVKHPDHKNRTHRRSGGAGGGLVNTPQSARNSNWQSFFNHQLNWTELYAKLKFVSILKKFHHHRVFTTWCLKDLFRSYLFDEDRNPLCYSSTIHSFVCFSFLHQHQHHHWS